MASAPFATALPIPFSTQPPSHNYFNEPSPSSLPNMSMNAAMIQQSPPHVQQQQQLQQLQQQQQQHQQQQQSALSNIFSSQPSSQGPRFASLSMQQNNGLNAPRPPLNAANSNGHPFPSSSSSFPYSHSQSSPTHAQQQQQPHNMQSSPMNQSQPHSSPYRQPIQQSPFPSPLSHGYSNRETFEQQQQQAQASLSLQSQGLQHPTRPLHHRELFPSHGEYNFRGSQDLQQQQQQTANSSFLSQLHQQLPQQQQQREQQQAQPLPRRFDEDYNRFDNNAPDSASMLLQQVLPPSLASKFGNGSGGITQPAGAQEGNHNRMPMPPSYYDAPSQVRANAPAASEPPTFMPSFYTQQQQQQQQQQRIAERERDMLPPPESRIFAYTQLGNNNNAHAPSTGVNERAAPLRPPTSYYDRVAPNQQNAAFGVGGHPHSAPMHPQPQQHLQQQMPQQMQQQQQQGGSQISPSLQGSPFRSGHYSQGGPSLLPPAAGPVPPSPSQIPGFANIVDPQFYAQIKQRQQQLMEMQHQQQQQQQQASSQSQPPVSDRRPLYPPPPQPPFDSPLRGSHALNSDGFPAPAPFPTRTQSLPSTVGADAYEHISDNATANPSAQQLPPHIASLLFATPPQPSENNQFSSPSSFAQLLSGTPFQSPPSSLPPAAVTSAAPAHPPGYQRSGDNTPLAGSAGSTPSLQPSKASVSTPSQPLPQQQQQPQMSVSGVSRSLSSASSSSLPDSSPPSDRRSVAAANGSSYSSSMPRVSAPPYPRRSYSLGETVTGPASTQQPQPISHEAVSVSLVRTRSSNASSNEAGGAAAVNVTRFSAGPPTQESRGFVARCCTEAKRGGGRGGAHAGSSVLTRASVSAGRSSISTAAASSNADFNPYQLLRTSPELPESAASPSPSHSANANQMKPSPVAVSSSSSASGGTPCASPTRSNVRARITTPILPPQQR